MLNVDSCTAITCNYKTQRFIIPAIIPLSMKHGCGVLIQLFRIILKNKALHLDEKNAINTVILLLKGTEI